MRDLMSENREIRDMRVGDGLLVAGVQPVMRGIPSSPGGAASDEPPHGSIVKHVRPSKGWQAIDFRELWQYRELVYFLTLRDVMVRYKQTVLGASWAVLQPLMMMAIFTLFFSRMAGMPSDGVPYPLFAFAGLLPWTFFATAISSAANSVVGSERLITKIYFPRLAIPLAAVGAAVVDFLIAFGLLVVMMAYYRVIPGPGILMLPVIFGAIAMAALGVGILLAALNVSYRDFRHVMPFLVQVWMFATPSVYMQITDEPASETSRPAIARQAEPRDLPPAQTGNRRTIGNIGRAALALNPMTGLIMAFRAAVLGTAIPWGRLVVSSAFALISLVGGCLCFRKFEDRFADII